VSLGVEDVSFGYLMLADCPTLSLPEATESNT